MLLFEHACVFFSRSRIGLERDLSHSADCKVRLGQTGAGLQEERRHNGCGHVLLSKGVGVCACVCVYGSVRVGGSVELIIVWRPVCGSGGQGILVLVLILALALVQVRVRMLVLVLVLKL